MDPIQLLDGDEDMTYGEKQYWLVTAAKNLAAFLGTDIRIEAKGLTPVEAPAGSLPNYDRPENFKAVN